MTLILPVLAVALAALCVWLTVRIVNRRERWAKRALLLTICAPVLYAVSFGPACWLSSHHTAYRPSVSAVYQPLFAAQFQYPEPIGWALWRYSTAFAAPGATAKMRPDGSCFWSTWELENVPLLGGLGMPDRLPGMSIILSIFGIAFAAFCVWLGVRIVNRRERWAKWTGIVLAAGFPICAYIGSYALMVNPIEMGAFSAGFYHGRVTPLYALPGRPLGSLSHAFCQRFFGPANSLDRRIRPETWKDKFEPLRGH